MLTTDIFRKIICSLALSFVLLVLIQVPVYAAFGISPASIDNNSIKKGTRYEKEMLISRDNGDEETVAVISPDLGELEKWVTFEPGLRVVMPVGVIRVPIKVIIDVPLDAALKDYEGVFRIYVTPEQKGEVKGISVVEGVRIDVALTTTEVSVIDLSIRAAKIPDTYINEDLILELTVKNDGNSPAAPSRVTVGVQDLLEKEIKEIETTDVEEASAYGVSVVKAYFKNYGLPEGEYYGNVRIYEGSDVSYEDRIVFAVLPAKVFREVCSGAPEVLVNNKVAIFVGITAFATLSATYAFFKIYSKSKKSKHKKLNTLIIVLIWALLVTASYTLIYANMVGLFDRECHQEEVKPDTTESATAQNNSEPTGSSVQGIATQEDGELEGKDLNSFGQLNVGVEAENGKYKVYKQSNLNSAVVYLASEGEEFTVIEELPEWYRVYLPNGIDGWLPKINVKNTVQEQRS